MADKKPPVQRKDDFDAHQFQMIGDAAFIVPKGARGGVRDMAPDDEGKTAAGPEAALRTDITQHRGVNAGPTPRAPTLAESQESRRYVEGPAPAMDTIYREPESKAKPAALDKAHVKQGSDVHFKEPEQAPQPVLQLVDPPEDEDPRTRHIQALMGPAPARDPNAEDQRFKTVNGYRFIA